MRFTPREKLPHEVPVWVEEGSFFFITIKCAVRGTNQLCHAGWGDAALESARFYHDKLKWHCRLMLLMPDHLHAVIAFPENAAMRRIVGNWKRYLTMHESTDWQDDFLDHRLRNRQEEVEKIDYILNNPVRQGLCERVEDWPWVFRPNDRPPLIVGG